MLSAAVSRTVLGQHAARRLYPFTLGSCCLRLVPSLGYPPAPVPNRLHPPIPCHFLPPSFRPSLQISDCLPPFRLPSLGRLIRPVFFTSTPPECLPITLQSVMPSRSL